MVLPEVLFAIMFGLKISGVEPVANWGWWKVSAVLWVPYAVVATYLLIVFIGAASTSPRLF